MKKIKIQYCSDLHLELDENSDEIMYNPLVPSGEILILAGDIIKLSGINDFGWFFDWASRNFTMTYWIPGNHEYYGHGIDEKHLSFQQEIRPNVMLLNNTSVEHEKFTMHFSTLWSDIIANNGKDIRLRVSDFRCIGYGDGFLTVEDFNSMHRASLDFLDMAFSKHNKKKSIVVTHHVPTLKNYPEHYVTSPINDAFATELSGLIERWKPTYWIYGNHHNNVPSFKVGKTAMLTNQLGYVQREDAKGFKRDATITV